MTEPFTRNITDRNRELLNQAESLVYKETAEGVRLETHVFFPRRRGAGEGGRGPVVLFFFSSMWDTGTVTQFAPQCMRFAEEGVLAMAVDYRVKSRHGTGPLEAMSDARTAIRWVRANAEHFEVDPGKIVASGGSGGAHLVVMAALRAGGSVAAPAAGETGRGGSEDDDLAVGCRPDALVLFSPVLDISKKGCGLEKFRDAKEAKLASPVHLKKPKDMPPTIIFHSTGDRRVPIEGARKFAAQLKRKKGVCELVEFGGVDHSFFNFNVNSELFELTMKNADRFLEENGIL